MKPKEVSIAKSAKRHFKPRLTTRLTQDVFLENQADEYQRRYIFIYSYGIYCKSLTY